MLHPVRKKEYLPQYFCLVLRYKYLNIFKSIYSIYLKCKMNIKSLVYEKLNKTKQGLCLEPKQMSANGE